MENKQLEQLFKGKLGSVVIEPSKAANDLFAKKVQVRKQKIFIKRIGIAASIFFVALGGLYTFLPDKAEKIDLAEDETIKIDLGIDIAENEAGKMIDIPSGKEVLVIDDNSNLDMDGQRQMAERPGFNVPPNDTNDENPAVNLDELVVDEGLANVVMDEQEIDMMIDDHVKESVYVEYFIEDPEGSVQSGKVQYEPVKITIEYIASGKNKEKSKADRKAFYSRIDNMKSVDEVFGDLREYKDRLFALDFKKENKVKEKSE
jgi:hypothetical protein